MYAYHIDRASYYIVCNSYMCIGMGGVFLNVYLYLLRQVGVVPH